MSAAQRETVVSGLQAGLSRNDIAEAAHCTPQSVTNIKRNLRMFGTPVCPSAGPPGPLRVITVVMMEAILALLGLKPWLYLYEVAWFLYDEFNIVVSEWTVGRTLQRHGWSKKTARFVSSFRDYYSRGRYQERLSSFASWQLVFVETSGIDTREGRRKTGWSPLGVAPTAYNRLGRSERFQILPAYTQNGVLTAAVYKGTTNNEKYEWWLENVLLKCCNRFPGPNSVVVMDNASFHSSERIKGIFERAGVVLLYLPP
ncbi:Homeodomain-like protein [Macrophomina phaseolina MS6]|uniref:Homeodomain-like protein n=1 Tax=Macrophomina phaseolina (strain MS6) TaxID=1126212 RepID=K2QJC7_MACPH|nr:Homeodomain-like protein [Macrophomina phaseolina MS6]